MINLFRLALIVLVTGFLGVLGILSCLFVPSGDGVIVLARLWSRLLLGICRVKVEVRGAEKIVPPGPYVFLSNHQSQFDIPAAAVTIPIQFRILAKKELFHIPVFGWVLRLSGFVGIERENREKAIRSLDEAARRIRRGRSLLIYAEGTRSPDGSLLPFKKGGFILAIQAGVPVIPLTVLGSRKVLPKGSLRIRPGTIHVVVGDPIDPRQYRVEEKEALMARVRAVMTATLEEGSPPE
jgi:1-acyl-sn-glycerol-3-phosphate acyltransferase